MWEFPAWALPDAPKSATNSCGRARGTPALGALLVVVSTGLRTPLMRGRQRSLPAAPPNQSYLRTRSVGPRWSLRREPLARGGYRTDEASSALWRDALVGVPDASQVNAGVLAAQFHLGPEGLPGERAAPPIGRTIAATRRLARVPRCSPARGWTTSRSVSSRPDWSRWSFRRGGADAAAISAQVHHRAACSTSGVLASPASGGTSAIFAGPSGTGRRSPPR